MIEVLASLNIIYLFCYQGTLLYHKHHCTKFVQQFPKNGFNSYHAGVRILNLIDYSNIRMSLIHKFMALSCMLLGFHCQQLVTALNKLCSQKKCKGSIYN